MKTEEWAKLQEKIKKSEKLKNEIDKSVKKLFDGISKRTFIVDGVECYVSYMNLENNILNFNTIKNKGTSLDYICEKQISITDFFDQYDKSINQI